MLWHAFVCRHDTAKNNTDSKNAEKVENKPTIPDVSQQEIDSIRENKKENTSEKKENENSNKEEKKSVPIIIESSELKAKLDKIKEKGGFEFYQGNWEAALPYYYELSKYRKNSDSFEMLGIIYEKLNRLPEAYEAYENAYSLGLDSSNNLNRLGLIAEKIGKYEKAQIYLEKAIEKNPRRADIILSYARCLNKQGENIAAAQVLAVLRDTTDSYAIKKAVEIEYQRLTKSNALNKDSFYKEKEDKNSVDITDSLTAISTPDSQVNKWICLISITSIINHNYCEQS